MGYVVLDTETANLIAKLEESGYDLESLGFKSYDDLPIAFQLSYIYDNGKRLTIRDAVGKPVIPMDISCSEVTHVTDRDIDRLTKQENGDNLKLKDTPEFKELVEIVSKDDNLYAVGHNVNYDIDVLRREGLDLSNVKIIDTLQLSKYLNKDNQYHRLQYLFYSNPDLVDKIRDLFSESKIKGLSKFKNIGSHNSLYDSFITKEIFEDFRDRLLQIEGNTKENILEKMHELSINPFILEEIPYGRNKGQIISEMDTLSILWQLKTDTDDINFKYTLNKTIENRGGFDAILKDMTTFDINKFFNVMENFTNEDFKSILRNEITKRESVVTLGFGKFANTPIDKVDESYLKWVQENNKNDIVLSKIKTELDRRAGDNNISNSLESTDLEDFLNGK